MKVLLVVAMEDELKAYLDKENFETSIIEGIKVYKANINNVELFLAKTDVGKVNAAIMSTLLISNIKPTYIINAGIAGGLNPGVEILDVVASSKVAYHDFDLTTFGYEMGQMDDNLDGFKGSEELLSLLPEEVKKGLIVSGDKFVAGLDNVMMIKRHFKKALACDMEGCAFGHVATLFSRPFLVIRVISDNVFIENVHETYYQEYRNKAIEKAAVYALKLINSL